MQDAFTGHGAAPTVKEWADAMRNAQARRNRRHAIQVRAIWLAIGIAVGVGASIPLASHAAELHAVAHGLSLHGRHTRSDGGEYQEVNKGFGIRAAFQDDLSFQVGRYENSWSETRSKRFSNYLAAEYTPVRVLGADFGGFIGVADGYPMNNSGPLVIPGVVARWAIGRISAVVRGGPTKHSKGIVTLELSMQLWGHK